LPRLDGRWGALLRWFICMAKSSLTPPKKHTHYQWLEFLKQIDREVPSSQHIHIILEQLRHP
jgi:hypothetical protein